MHNFVKGIIFSLVKESLRIQNAYLFAKLCNVLLDEFPIDLQGKHQIGENAFGQSEPLPTLKRVFKQRILFLTLIEL